MMPAFAPDTRPTIFSLVSAGRLPAALLAILFAGCRETPPPAAPTSAAPSPAPSAPPVAPPPAKTADTPPPVAPPPAAPPSHDLAEDETGGECVQTAYAGTCTATAGDTFTFTGKIDGKAVVLKGNLLYRPALRPPPGKGTPCELKFSKSGTCTPCTLSIGGCGEAALDVFRARL